MIEIEEVRKLKEQYEYIFQVNINDEVFIGRELTKAEFDRAVRDYPDEGEREEYVCKLCILYPSGYDYNECYAGIPTTLAYHVLKESGLIEYGSVEMLNEARAEMSLFDNQIGSIICAAFPNLTLEEIDGWTLRKQIKYLSRAEWVLREIHHLDVSIGIETTQPKDDWRDFPELKNESQIMKNAGGR